MVKRKHVAVPTCGLFQAALWVDHGREPIRDDDFLAMGNVPFPITDWEGATRRLFVALRTGEIAATGIYWGPGPREDRTVRIPRQAWVWKDVSWKDHKLAIVRNQRKLGHYGMICVPTRRLFKLFPKASVSKVKPRADRRGRPPNPWDEFYAAIVVKALKDGSLPKQGKLEKYMLGWTYDNWGEEIGESTARVKLKPIYDALDQAGIKVGP
jgi:hypothetical protein